MSKVVQKDTSKKRFSTAVGNLRRVLSNLFGNGDQPEIDSLETYANNPKNKNPEDIKTAQVLLESLKHIDSQEQSLVSTDKVFNKKYDVAGVENTINEKTSTHEIERDEREL